eukprot:2132041-Rhodomonas_salina.1
MSLNQTQAERAEGIKKAFSAVRKTTHALAHTCTHKLSTQTTTILPATTQHSAAVLVPPLLILLLSLSLFPSVHPPPLPATPHFCTGPHITAAYPATMPVGTAGWTK